MPEHAIKKITRQEYEALVKTAKNIAYLKEIDTAMDQLEKGQGQVHELIEVEDDDDDG